jgi:hypothetical protein
LDVIRLTDRTMASSSASLMKGCSGTAYIYVGIFIMGVCGGVKEVRDRSIRRCMRLRERATTMTQTGLLNQQ